MFTFGRTLVAVIACLSAAGSAVAQDDPAKSPPDRLSAPLEWQAGEKLTFFGEVGFRAEYIANEQFAENDSTADDDYFYRDRVRLRFGAEFSPRHWFTAGFRFSTGQSNYPASGWSSFSDQFRRDPVALDRVYINLNAGKFQLRMGGNANPMFRPTGLVWDEDVQPAGFAETYRPGRWELVAGQFMISEVRSTSGLDSGSFLFAHGVNYSPQIEGSITVGIFQYLYSNPDAIAAAIDDGLLDPDFKTNRIAPDDERRFFSGYNSVGGSLLYSRGMWRITGEVVLNLRANQDASLGDAYAEKEDIGYGGLLRYGVLNEPGDWSVEAGYFHIEADATIAAYNSDDLQQTNVNSVPVWLRLRLPGEANLVWDTYFQKRINTSLYLAGGNLHDENALKVRTRLTISLGF